MNDEARFTLGGNLPPLTPWELSLNEASDLFIEASNWCDGAKIETQDQADALSGLRAQIKAAMKLADGRRVDEAKPHDEAKKEIQARFNTLIGDTKTTGKGKLVLADEACQTALTPWLKKIDDEKRAAAEKLRQEQLAKQAEAEAAFRKAREANDLEAKAAAEQLAIEAAQAEKLANRADKATTVKTGLRIVVTAEVTDMSAFAKWAWIHDKAALEEHFRLRASDLAKSGWRNIAGVDVIESKEAR
jgi:hypothetical protein